MNTFTPGSPTGSRFAALVDIENTLFRHGALLTPADATTVLGELRRTVAGIPTRVAIGPGLMRRHLADLASFGGGISLVEPAPDAADTALIEAGRAFAAASVTDLVIVSGDHAFATLASVARLHVVSHPGNLSRRLRLAATTITPIATRPCTATATSNWKAAQ